MLYIQNRNIYLQNDTGTNYYKEIPLSEILAVESTGKGKPASITSAEGGDLVSHCFEIRTANVDYFIGKRLNIFCVPFHIYTDISQQKTNTSNSELTMFSGIYILAEDGDKGGEMARQWEASIRQALMPVVHVTGPQGSVSSTKVS